MKRTRWRAIDPSGIAHAFIGSGRSLCGVANVPEIWDRPTRLRCALCLMREAQLEEARKRFVTS